MILGIAMTALLNAQIVTPPAHPLVFISDTQAPMRVERWWLGYQQNESATEAIFNDILQRPPTDVFLLGDVVELGYSERRWQRVDTFLQRARDHGSHVHGILGNHELMGRSRAGEQAFQRRFPSHVRTGYSVNSDGVMVVLLNSNFGVLSEAEITEQQERYERLLEECDRDTAVKAVIVCCHHSPFSGSKLVGSNDAVQQRFVGSFMQHRKTCAFISGHAHIFQHFEVRSKHFFVIGGGGGPHHPVRPLKNGMVCTDADYDPMFHYLTVERGPDSLHVVSHVLDDALARTWPGCEYDIPLVSGGAAP